MPIELKSHTLEVIKRLRIAYPTAHCALNHTSPFELLIATILSAQCTDARVNIVTAGLFRKYPRPIDFLQVSMQELEKDIHSTGFFRNKAKNIRAACTRLIEEFDGQVPQTMDELLTLGGVARKTANVVLGNAFGIAGGVVVDTHVSRISQLLGLTKNKTPKPIERDLIALVPKKDWIIFPHMMIFHGRQICVARRPKCNLCPLADICPSYGLFCFNSHSETK